MRRMGARPPLGSKRGDEFLRLFLLRRRAFLRDFLQDLARSVLVADLEVGLGQLELRADRLSSACGGGIEAPGPEVEAGAARRGGWPPRPLGGFSSPPNRVRVDKR